MSSWEQFPLARLRSPKLKLFKMPMRWRILEFVALSCEEGKKGMVDLLDDEIARSLEIDLDAWLNLRDLMILRRLLRQVDGAAGKRYEVCLWLLPDQGALDGRSREGWDSEFSDPVDIATEPVNVHSQPSKGALRVQKYRWRKRFKQEHNRLPTAREEAEWVVERNALEGSVTPECNADVTHNTSEAADTPPIPLESLEETIADNNNEERCNGALPSPPVTRYSVTAEEEKAVVVALLSQEGKAHALPVSLAAALVEQHGPQRCRRQLEWLPYRGELKSGTLGGRLRRAIEEDWREPQQLIRLREQRELRERQQRERLRREVPMRETVGKPPAAELFAAARNKLRGGLSDDLGRSDPSTRTGAPGAGAEGDAERTGGAAPA